MFILFLLPLFATSQLHTCDEFTPLSCSPMVTNITASSWSLGLPVSPVCNCRSGFYGSRCEYFQRPCSLPEVQKFCSPLYGASCSAECYWNDGVNCTLVASTCTNRTTRPCTTSEVLTTCGPLGSACTWIIGQPGSANASSCACGQEVLDTQLRYSSFACVSRHNTTIACPASKTANISLWAEQCGVAGTLGCSIQVVWLDSAQIAASSGVSVPSTIDGPTVDYKLATFYSGQTLYVLDPVRQQYNVGSYFAGSVPYEFVKCTCAQDEDTFAVTLATTTRQQFAAGRATFTSTSISYQFCDVQRVANIQRGGDWLSTSSWARPVCNGVGIRKLNFRYGLSSSAYTPTTLKTAIEQWWTDNAVDYNMYAFNHKRFPKYNATTLSDAGKAYTPWWLAYLVGPVPQITDATYSTSSSSIPIGVLNITTKTITDAGKTWPPGAVPFMDHAYITLAPAVDRNRYLTADTSSNSMLPLKFVSRPTPTVPLNASSIWGARADTRDTGWMRLRSVGYKLCEGVNSPVSSYNCDGTYFDKWRIDGIDDSKVPYHPTFWESGKDNYRATLWAEAKARYLCVDSSFALSYSSYVFEECIWVINRVMTANMTQGYVSIRDQGTGKWWYTDGSANPDYLSLTDFPTASANIGGYAGFYLDPFDDSEWSSKVIVHGQFERVVWDSTSGQVQESGGPVGGTYTAHVITTGPFSCNSQIYTPGARAQCLSSSASVTTSLRSRNTNYYLIGSGLTVSYSSSSTGSLINIVQRPGSRGEFNLGTHGGLDSGFPYLPLLPYAANPSGIIITNSFPRFRNRVSFTPLLHLLYNSSCVCPSGFSGSDCSTLTGITSAHAPGLQSLVTAGTDEYLSASTAVDSGGNVRCSTGGLTQCIARSTSLLSKAGCVNGVFNFTSTSCVCDPGWLRNSSGFCVVVDTSVPSNCGGRDCSANGGTCSSASFGACNCTLSGYDPATNCTMTQYDNLCYSHNCTGRGTCGGGNVCRDCDWHPNGGFTGTRCQTIYINTPCVNGVPAYSAALGIFCNCSTSWYGPACNNSGCPSPGNSACSGRGGCGPDLTCDLLACNASNAGGCDCGLNLTASCGTLPRCSNVGNCTLKYDSSPWRAQYAGCDCNAGYTGQACQTNINECASVPCTNAAVCVDLVNGFSCTCVAGFTGTVCQTNIDECASSPCSNGATCSDLVNGFSCACATGFTGVLCQTDINECVSLPCQNGASCVDNVGSYLCTCVAGFTGTQCQTNVNECASTPCRNGATCTDLTNGYTCSCVVGFSGIACETNINECASTPCQNGATCNDLINGFSCICVSGFVGTLCQTDTDECVSVPCQNGATCVNVVNGYTCSCQPGYTGVNCQSDIDECASNPCRNAGNCTNNINGFVCECAPGFGGITCAAFGNVFVPEGNSTHLCDQYTPAYCSPMVSRINATLFIGGLPLNAQCTCREGFYGNRCENYTRSCTLPELQEFCGVGIGQSCDATCRYNDDYRCSLVPDTCVTQQDRPCTRDEATSLCGPLSTGCTMPLAPGVPFDEATCLCGAEVRDLTKSFSPKVCTSRNYTTVPCPEETDPAKIRYASYCGAANVLGCTLQIVYFNFALTPNHILPYDVYTLDVTGIRPWVWDSKFEQYNLDPRLGGSDGIAYAKCKCMADSNTFALTLRTSTRVEFDPNRDWYQFGENRPFLTFYPGSTWVSSIGYQFCDNIRLLEVRAYGESARADWLRPTCNGWGIRAKGPANSTTTGDASRTPIKDYVESWLTTNYVNAQTYALNHRRLVGGDPQVRVITPYYFWQGKIDSYYHRLFIHEYQPWWFTRLRTSIWYSDSWLSTDYVNVSQPKVSVGTLNQTTGQIQGTLKNWSTTSAQFINKNVMVTIRSTVQGRYLYSPYDVGATSGIPSIEIANGVRGREFIWGIQADSRDGGEWVRLRNMNWFLCGRSDGAIRTMTQTLLQSSPGYRDSWTVRRLLDLYDDEILPGATGVGRPSPPSPWQSGLAYDVAIMYYNTGSFLCGTAIGALYLSPYLDDECVWGLDRVNLNNLPGTLLSIRGSSSNRWWKSSQSGNVQYGTDAEVRSNIGGVLSFEVSPNSDGPSDTAFYLFGYNLEMVKYPLAGSISTTASGFSVYTALDFTYVGAYNCYPNSIADYGYCLGSVPTTPTKLNVPSSNGYCVNAADPTAPSIAQCTVSGYLQVVARPGSRHAFELGTHGGLSQDFVPLVVLSYDKSSLFTDNKTGVLPDRSLGSLILSDYYNTKCTCPPWAGGDYCDTIGTSRYNGSMGIRQTIGLRTVQAADWAYASIDDPSYYGDCTDPRITWCQVLSFSLLSKSGCINGIFNFSSLLCICDEGWQQHPTEFTCTVTTDRNPYNCSGVDCHWNGGSCSTTARGVCNCSLSGMDPRSGCRMTRSQYDCEPHNCSNRATCLGNGTCGECEWHPNGGFRNNCSQPYLNSPCVHGRITYSSEMGIHCACDPTWFGASCNESGCPLHDGKVCNGMAECRPDLTCNPTQCLARGGVGCDCSLVAEGFCGREGRCNAKGNCTAKYTQLYDFAQTASCDCIPGYDSSANCGVGIDECLSNPCRNGALCIDLLNGYTCQCDPGWTGSTCAVDIDECSSSPCQNFATCVNQLGAFSCQCASGYTGVLCQTQIDECQSSPCQNGATCLDLVNGFVCSCVPGYVGTTCGTDVNECASSPCVMGTCLDHINSFQCVCAPGYTGTTCAVELNGCTSSPCQNGATCTNLLGPFNCSCPPGYTGTLCELVICDQLFCGNGATCAITSGGAQCVCVVGFTGVACETNIDECASNPCSNGGACVDSLNRYTCNCASGFHGTTCAAFDDRCASNPCQNFGQCNDAGDGTYTCQCIPGTTGTYCQIDLDECASAPCMRSSLCRDQINGFFCFCPAGTTGLQCETDIDECASAPCQGSDSVCHDLLDGYSCTCGPLRRGSLCDIQVDPCSLLTCVENAVCVSGQCVCKDGWRGTRCTIDVDECALGISNCTGGSVCANLPGSFECKSLVAASTSSAPVAVIAGSVVGGVVGIGIVIAIVRYFHVLRYARFSDPFE